MCLLKLPAELNWVRQGLGSPARFRFSAIEQRPDKNSWPKSGLNEHAQFPPLSHLSDHSLLSPWERVKRGWGERSVSLTPVHGNMRNGI